MLLNISDVVDKDEVIIVRDRTKQGNRQSMDGAINTILSRK